MKDPVKIGVITAREYGWLKSMQTLEPHEQQKVNEYEKENIPKEPFTPPTKEAKKEVTKIEITKALLWNYFKAYYFQINKKNFIETPDSIQNIAVIINYFAFNDDFYKSGLLVRKYNNPSFNKGLLIIGNYGNGKTSIMKTLSFMFEDLRMMSIRFRHVSSNQLVSDWECCATPADKQQFFMKYMSPRLCIDDVKKEKKASNFGVTEAVKEILEKRYDKGLKTFITCNYRESDNTGDLDDALMEFNRYGDHIYDRLFEMFNIVQFKGKSFRK